MNIGSGRECSNISFVDTLKQDYDSIEKGYCISNLYVELGLYYEQVKRYIDLFPSENIKIIFYSEYKKNNLMIINQVYEFLNLKSTESLENKVINNVRVHKYKNLQKIYKTLNLSNYIPLRLKKMLRSLLTKKIDSKLSDSEKKYLYNKYFKENIEQLETLLKINLNQWKYGGIDNDKINS